MCIRDRGVCRAHGVERGAHQLAGLRLGGRRKGTDLAAGRGDGALVDVSEPGGLESIEVASSGERLAGCIEGRVKRGRLERSRVERSRVERSSWS